MPAANQIAGRPLTPAFRRDLLQTEAKIGGAWQPVYGDVRGCAMGRIRETYTILNPATVAAAVRAARPEGGYPRNPDLSLFGAPMLRVSHVFTVYPNGTVVTELDHQALQPVRWQGFLALMYQEKCCPVRGQALRYIPGVKPLASREGSWDFSMPVDLAGPFPRFLPVTEREWIDPAWPPDRQIELIRDRDSCIAFASGILPVMDGAPQRRRKGLLDALTLVSSRKSYLTFRGAGSPALAGSAPPLSRAQGAVYRTYYPSAPDASLFAVPYGEYEYLYADFMGRDGPMCRRWLLPADCQAAPLYVRDVQWTREKNALVLTGSRGFAVFRVRR